MAKIENVKIALDGEELEEFLEDWSAIADFTPTGKTIMGWPLYNVEGARLDLEKFRYAQDYTPEELPIID